MTIRILTLIDASDAGAKLKQMCDVAVPENTMPLMGGAVGTRITLDITEITIFSGRPRFRGVIVRSTEPVGQSSQLNPPAPSKAPVAKV